MSHAAQHAQAHVLSLTQTQTHTDTDTDTQTHTHRHTHRHTDTQTHRHTHTHTGTHRHTDTDTHKLIHNLLDAFFFPERMEENFACLGVSLDDEDMEALDSMTTDAAVEEYEALYRKCVVRDTPLAETGKGIKASITLN